MKIRSPGSAACYQKCRSCDREFKLEWPTWFGGILSHRNVHFCPFCGAQELEWDDKKTPEPQDAQ